VIFPACTTCLRKRDPRTGEKLRLNGHGKCPYCTGHVTYDPSTPSGYRFLIQFPHASTEHEARAEVLQIYGIAPKDVILRAGVRLLGKLHDQGFRVFIPVNLEYGCLLKATRV